MTPELPPESDRTIFTPPPDGAGPVGPALETAGDRIGPYRLLSPLGEGGFGTVWLAERRQPFLQKVALKIVKPGMDSKAVVARFEQERQALAVMSHPGVAKVLDGGLTPTGRPYFAMEFVQGEPLTLFCDRHRLPVKARLELFAQVCDAVQHAHTKGIIHRDLKPSNVLVALGDGDRPAPKVIDFGIAKAVTGRMTEQTVFTETGQMIGTPEYMSPEQADPGAVDVDTRTDVYSLGVMLYELLAGALPFDPKDLRSKAYREIQRVIREVDPPAPSVRLSTIATRDQELAGRIGSARRETAGPLALTLRRELEWIPLKAMRKERQERYASSGELALDVRNYLDGKPLVAAPESAAYRLRKFVRRNRVLVAGSAAVLGALVVGLGLATWQWREASRQRDAAEAARAEADAAKDRAVASETEAIREKEAAQLARDDAARERDAANAAREAVEANAYVANIQMAASWLEQESPARAAERLAACPAPRRGWEWSLLDAKADRSLARIDLGESKPTDAQFTPDSRTLLVNGHDGTVSIVDLARGETIRSIRVDPEPGGDSLLALSPDGKRFVRTVAGGAPRVHEVETGRLLCELRNVETPIESLQFSTDGSLILAGTSSSGQAWNAADGAVVRAFPAEGGYLAVRFSPDGRSVFLAGGGERLNPELPLGVVDIRSGERRFTIAPPETDYDDGRFSPDGRLLFLQATYSRVHIFDATDGTMLREVNIASNLEKGTLSPDGQRFATFDSRSGLVVLDLSSGAALGRRPIDSQNLREGSPVFSPDGRRLLSLRPDGTIVVSDSTTAGIVATIPGTGRTAGDARLTVSPDGFRGAMVTGDSLRIVDLANVLPAPDFAGPVTLSPTGDALLVHTPNHGENSRVQLRRPDGEVIVAIEGVTTAIENADFSPDGTRLVTVSKARAGRLHDARDGRLISELLGGKRDITAAAFHPDGSIIATGSRDGIVRLWNGRTGAPLAELTGHLAGIACIAFSPDGSTLASGAADGTARLWDPVGRAARATLAGHPAAVQQVRFSPDGRTLATLTDGESPAGLVRKLFRTVTQDPVARIWDVGSGTLSHTLEAETTTAQARVNSIDFSPDGRFVALAGRGASSAIFDIASGKRLRELAAGTARIVAVRFHPDGSRIASLTEDLRILILDPVSGGLIAEFGDLPANAERLAFSPDGTRLAVGPYDFGETRLLDAVSCRIRYAERQLRAAGRLADLGATAMRELRGESPPTWLTDMRLPANRPPLSSGPEDATLRQAEDRRIAEMAAKSRRERLHLATNEQRIGEAISIAFEVDPGWMTANELNSIVWGGVERLPPKERDANLDRLLILAELAASESGRKNSDILMSLSRVLWHRGEKDRAIDTVRESITIDEAVPESQRSFGHALNLHEHRRVLNLYRRLEPGAELREDPP